MNPSFKKRLNRAVRLFCRETKDGCVQCRELGVCYDHRILFMDVMLNPRKYVTVEPDPKPRSAEVPDAR